MAYAAGLAAMDVAEFDRAWRSRCGHGVVDSVLGDGADDNERTALPYHGVLDQPGAIDAVIQGLRILTE